MPPNGRWRRFGKPFGLELYRKDKSPETAQSGHVAASQRKSTNAATSGFTPRRYDTNPAAVALLWEATPELDD